MAKVHKHNSPKVIWILFAVFLIVLAVSLMPMKAGQRYVSPTKTEDVTPVMPFDFGKQRFMIDDQELTFTNGSYASSDETNGLRTAKIVNPSANASGKRAAAILIDSPGGTGAFYYLVGAMLKDGKEIYSSPLLLGDRIKIVTVKVNDAGAEDNGIITVHYLNHAAYAAMSADPTEEMTATYAFEDNGNLIEVLR